MYKDPQTADYFIADCGCEIYEGNTFYEFNGKTYCIDCLYDELMELPKEELVRLAGAWESEVRTCV